MNKALYALTFAVGAFTGFAASYFIIKKKYEKLSQEEIESVKAAFERRCKKIEEGYETGVDVTSEKDQNIEVIETTKNDVEYKKYVKSYDCADNCGWMNLSTAGTNTKKPYLIAPEELGEYNDYRIVSLTYYADNVLTDENDEIIKNVNDIIGKESLNHFGDYVDDAVYVRNEALETDYEIILDPHQYSEVSMG